MIAFALGLASGIGIYLIDSNTAEDEADASARSYSVLLAIFVGCAVAFGAWILGF